MISFKLIFKLIGMGFELKSNFSLFFDIEIIRKVSL